MRLLGINFAPLQVPWERRIQTLALVYALSTYFFSFVPLLIFIGILFTDYYYIPLLYFVWIFYDRFTPERGGRQLLWLRKLSFYKICGQYFPITLHKTVDLDPNKNYILGYHPHGVMPFGAFGNFLSNGTGFDRLFPNITPKVVTIDLNFLFPICREIMLFRGHISSKKESIEWVLRKSGSGNAIVIVVGGAREALDAIPNTMKLTIKCRKGFVKLALKHGASLVPVISFGENETYWQAQSQEGSALRKMQTTIKDFFSFSFPLFCGRGIFQYSFGLLPYRTPINTVVGKPIDVVQVTDPTEEQINELHSQYISELVELYNANKAQFFVTSPPELILQ